MASGNTPDPFGFTGELHSQGLVYLRARWYDPSVGTFTSRDPFAGYPQTPYSLHPYQYGYSNPIINTDPTGEQTQHTITQKNATDQLIKDLKFFADSPEAQEIKDLKTHHPSPAPGSINPITDIAIGLQCQEASYLEFAALVREKAPLDVKVAYKDEFKEYMVMRDRAWLYDLSGNLLYGFVGRYVGFTAKTLKVFAGIAQYKNQCLDRNNPGATGPGIDQNCNIINSDPQTWDQPSDQAQIEAGIELYEKHSSLFLTSFQPKNRDDLNQKRDVLNDVLFDYRDRIDNRHIPAGENPYRT